MGCSPWAAEIDWFPLGRLAVHRRTAHCSIIRSNLGRSTLVLLFDYDESRFDFSLVPCTRSIALPVCTYCIYLSPVQQTHRVHIHAIHHPRLLLLLPLLLCTNTTVRHVAFLSEILELIVVETRQFVVRGCHYCHRIKFRVFIHYYYTYITTNPSIHVNRDVSPGSCSIAME